MEKISNVTIYRPVATPCAIMNSQDLTRLDTGFIRFVALVLLLINNIHFCCNNLLRFNPARYFFFTRFVSNNVFNNYFNVLMSSHYSIRPDTGFTRFVALISVLINNIHFCCNHLLRFNPTYILVSSGLLLLLLFLVMSNCYLSNF